RLAPAVRENWNRAVLRCLEPDPGKRYQAARELLVDLESRSSQLRLFRRFLRQRRRWVRGTGAAAAVVLLAWLGWWLWPAHAGAVAAARAHGPAGGVRAGRGAGGPGASGGDARAVRGGGALESGAGAAPATWSRAAVERSARGASGRRGGRREGVSGRGDVFP